MASSTFTLTAPPERRHRPPAPLDRPKLDRSLDTVERFVDGYAATPRGSRLPASDSKRPSPRRTATEELHIQLSRTTATYTSTSSSPPSPDRTSPARPRHARRSFTEPLRGSFEMTPARPSTAGSKPRTAPGTPLDRLPSGAKVLHLDPERPTNSRRGRSMNDLAISTTSTVTVGPRDSPTTPTHARSRSFTASAKNLARKASGKLRSLAARSSTAPPMPTAEEQAWRLGSLNLSRSNSIDEKGKQRAWDVDEEADERFGLAVSTLDELTPTHAAIDGLPVEQGSPSRRASTPHLGRQRSISKPARVREVERSPEKNRQRTSSPVLPRKKSSEGRSSPTLETGFVRRALGKKKSTASLATSSSSPALFSMTAPPGLPPPPHISLFPFELYTASSVDCIPLPPVPVLPTADWPPKRTSSTRRPPSPPTTPSLSLSSSLSALSMLSSPAQTVDRGASFDSARLRFPSSFGFVGRPSDDLLAPPSIMFPPTKAVVIEEVLPVARENAASVPKPLNAEKEAERTRKFDELLRGSSEKVIRKTLTPKVAGSTPASLRLM